MKLGEALSLRATQGRKLADLRTRAVANASSQEGDDPHEQPLDVVNEFDALSMEHGTLVAQITRTNVHSGMDGSLMQREHFRRQRNTLVAVVEQAQENPNNRYSMREIKMVANVDVPDVHAKIADLDEQIRRMDAEIQEKNWATDLLE